MTCLQLLWLDSSCGVYGSCLKQGGVETDMDWMILLYAFLGIVLFLLACDTFMTGHFIWKGPQEKPAIDLDLHRSTLEHWDERFRLVTGNTPMGWWRLRNDPVDADRYRRREALLSSDRPYRWTTDFVPVDQRAMDPNYIYSPVRKGWIGPDGRLIPDVITRQSHLDSAVLNPIVRGQRALPEPTRADPNVGLRAVP